MIRPGLFLAFILLLLGICVRLANPSPAGDAFAGLPRGESLALDDLAVEDIAALKLRHVLDYPPYRVLVLGNSRSLSLTAADLGLAPHEAFNLSLTGESLRASTLLLEWLAEAGRLPELALISFDNAELNYFSNPSWAPAPTRWRQMARDLEAGLTRPSIPPDDLGRMAFRHARTEATLWARNFNSLRIWRGASVLFGGDRLAPVARTPDGYQADGSRPQSVPGTPYRAGPLPTPNRNVLPAYFDYDLERLARIAAAGTRIVIYETPLFPSLQRERAASPSAVAAETRAAFVGLCARHRLECHSSPPIFDDLGLAWPDASHPPAAALAAWIKGFLKPGQESASR